jgi:amidohydrolase
MNSFNDHAERFFDYTREIRRDFHRNPELGFQEFKTGGKVADELNALGLEVWSGVAKTGVVALLDSGRPGPTALLRFDMDALPIQEQTGAEYASTNPGVMHACGHDGHTAIGLSVARILDSTREHLRGKIKFLFQPAEEGFGGALKMIEAGVLENPKPDFALALHLWNEQPIGWLGITPGPVMAAAERFEIKLSGKGGHGAAPHLAVDPIYASAQIITALQSIVSRNVPPLKTAVVSMTKVHGGDTFNVIPPQVNLMGTIRSFEPEVRKRVLGRFEQIVNGLAGALECEAEIEIQNIAPAVVNDKRISELVHEIAQHQLPDCRLDNEYRTMGSEDMAFIL